MKKTLSKMGLSFLISLASLSMATSTFSWLSYLVSIDNSYSSDNKIDGSTLGAYFAYGNGIPVTVGPGNRVYGINKPRHLYNLAWLQYLGYFNKVGDNGNLANQFYFEIDPNLEGELDMTGWVLPPIGTESHPFIGNFNGNGKVISNLTISNEFGDFNTHPSEVTSEKYNQPDIVGFFGVVGNKNGLEGYSSSTNEISTLGLKDLTVETASSTTLVGLAAGYVDAEIKNVAIENPTLIVSNQGATKYSESLTNNISDYLAVGYCNDTDNKRYTADISKVTNSLYNVNVSNLQPFTITEQGINVGWGGSIDMLEMYTNLDKDWKKLKHGYGSGNSIDPLSYVSARTDSYDIDGNLISSNPTSTTQNDMPYNDYGQVSGSGDNHKYFNVSKNSSLTNDDTEVTESLQTSSVSYVVQTEGTKQATEERFMCLTGRKDVSITNGLSLTTNNYPTYSARYISTTVGNQTRYLTVSNGAIVNNSTSQTTAWAISGNRLFTVDSSNNKVYLVCNNQGTLSLTTSVNNASYWNYNSNNIFSCLIGNNAWVLTYNNNAWKCQTATVDHYLLHDANNHYLKHNKNNNIQYNNSTYSVTSPNTSDTDLWWYKNGNNYRTTNNGDYYLVKHTTQSGDWWSGYTYTYSLRVRSDTTDYMTYDGEYFNNGNHYIFWDSTNNYFIASNTQKTLMIAEPIFSVQSTINYSGSSNFIAYNTETTKEDATLSIPHTYFPLRYNGDAPDIKNTGYVVSGGNYFENPYGDIRVSSYSIGTYLSGVSTNDSTDSENKKYKKIDTVYTKKFDTSNGNLTDKTTNSDAATVYASSKRYAQSKEALEHVLGGQNNAYGLHFMNAEISDQNPAVVPGAVINGSIRKNLELPTDCIDFNLKEKGVINFFAGSYYKDSDTQVANKSFFSLYEVDREDPVSTATITNTESAITLTYKGIDESKRMKFVYTSDPFNVAGHTYSHITINGNTVNEKGELFDITNYNGSQQPFFTLDKGSKKYEYFNLKFYDNQGVCYLDFDVTTQRTKLNEIRRITRVYSASADTDGAQSYCYQYDIGGSIRYSVPYMYVMGRKVDLDGETPYIEGRLTANKPQGYDKMEFSTTCIEVGPSGGSLRMNGSKGYVYYFEIPMNEGEFALGSVKNYNGAYLMYLDIAANATLIKRTVVTEHFVFNNQQHKYPLGVAIVLSASSALSGATATPSIPIEPADSIYVELDDSFRGVINIELSSSEPKDTATLIRSNMPNAPNDYSVDGHATIQYISDDLTAAHGTKELDLNHGLDNLVECADEESENSLKEYYTNVVQTDVKRLNYYDFSVTDGVTHTIVTQTTVGNSSSRTVYQDINEEEVAESNIKIYVTDNNGVARSTTKDQIDFSGYTFNSAENTIVLQYYYVTGNNEAIENVIVLNATINADNYYETDGYTVTVTNSGNQIKIVIIKIATSEEIAEITLNGNTPSTNTPIYVPVV